MTLPTPPPVPLAELSGVTVEGHGGRLVLDDVTLAFARGASTALIGHNGAGKTTILRLLLGLTRPTSGVVRVFGLDLRAASYDEMRAHRLRTGYVFEAAGLWANRTVFQNIALPLTYHGALEDAEVEARVRALADELGIVSALPLPSYMANASVSKRMLVARALVLEPSLLLCDEPQVGMVRKEALRVHEAFARRQRERQMTLIFTDHDGDIRPFSADQLWHFSEGKVRDRASTLPPGEAVPPSFASGRARPRDGSGA